MSGDLLALADALDRLADEATPGPWVPYFTLHGDPSIVPAEHALLSRRLADVAVSPDDYGRANAHLLAQAPALARALAATLRAVVGLHDEALGADGVAGIQDRAAVNAPHHRQILERHL